MTITTTQPSSNAHSIATQKSHPLYFHASIRPCLNTAPPALRRRMLLGIVIRDEQLAILAIAPRRLLRNLHDIENRRRIVEDGVHFFERAVGRLGIEEVDDRDDEGIAGELVSCGVFKG